MAEAWIDDVLAFWLGVGEEAWFASDEALDREIAERFRELWEEQRQLPAAHFLGSPEEAAAAVILFDQFPRNMFRGHAEQFATDPLALAVTHGALDRDYEERLGREARIFLLMPLQHSEDLDDQQRSLLEFARLGSEEHLRYARLHHDVIARFGRFPHRNKLLGRTPRPDEVAAGDVVPW